MPTQLSDAEHAVIASIMSGDKAWSKVGDLVKAGHDLETIADLMLGKEAMLERWDHPEDGETVTLTTWGAYQWPLIMDETLELAERAVLLMRPKGKTPLTPQQLKQLEDERCLLSRVPFWVEGNQGDVPAKRRERLKEYRDPLPELVVDPCVPEYLADEVTGEDFELFTQLFDGTKVKGIKIKIDKRLKGAKQQPKRRRAG